MNIQFGANETENNLEHWQRLQQFKMKIATTVAIIGFVILVLGLTMAAQASQSQAIDSVERLNKNIAELLNKYTHEVNGSSKANNGLSKELIKLFENSLDIEVISQSVIGAPWRSASPGQRQRFQIAFTDYLAQKYSSHFPKFVGSEFQVVGAKQIKNSYFLVNVDATIGNKSTGVEWYVLKRDGQYRIVNIALSNTSILNVERRVIRSLLQQRAGNIDQLSAYLPIRYQQSN